MKSSAPLLLSLMIFTCLLPAADKTPTYYSSFSPNGKAAIEGDMKLLNLRDAATMKKYGLSSALTIDISSEGMIYGGEKLSLSGKVLNRDTGVILSLDYEGDVNDDKVTISGLGLTKYSVALTVRGRTVFMDEIRIKDIATSLTMKLVNNVTVSGRLSGIPKLARETPFLCDGPYSAAINEDGDFSLQTRSGGNSLIAEYFVAAKGGGRQRVRQAVRHLSEGAYMVDSFDLKGGWTVAGKCHLSPHYLSLSLSPVLKNMVARIRSSDSIIQVTAWVQNDGEFEFNHVPNGSYLIDVNDEAGAVPLFSNSTKVIQVEGRDLRDVVLDIDR